MISADSDRPIVGVLAILAVALAGVLSPLVQAIASQQEALRRAEALAKAQSTPNPGQQSDEDSSDDSNPCLIDPICCERDRTVRTFEAFKHSQATAPDQSPMRLPRRPHLPANTIEGLTELDILHIAGPHQNHAPHAPPILSAL